MDDSLNDYSVKVSYEDIVFMQGDDYDEFERALYPLKSPWSDVEAGLAYLAQWDYGEASEALEERPGTDTSSREYETADYVMTWSTSYGWASLVRKVASAG
jgi:hypothetical protein